MRSAREILRDAAEYISENGHHKGALYHCPDDDDGSQPAACALGAIRAVMTDKTMDSYFPAVAQLAAHLRSSGHTCKPPWSDHEITTPTAVIPFWNDAPNTTAEDVILAMKRAAEE